MACRQIVEDDNAETVHISSLREAAAEWGASNEEVWASNEVIADGDQQPEVQGSFWACLPNLGGNPGLGFDIAEGPFLRVCKVVEGGAATLYNDVAPPEERVGEGDFVLEVNGMKGSASAMMLALHSHSGARLLVVRPFAFVVQGLDRSSGPLGLDLCCPPQSRSLEVAEVFETGAIADRNTLAATSWQKVRRHDRIISVNGNTGSSEELLANLQSAPIVSLEVARPSTDM